MSSSKLQVNAWVGTFICDSNNITHLVNSDVVYWGLTYGSETGLDTCNSFLVIEVKGFTHIGLISVAAGKIVHLIWVQCGCFFPGWAKHEVASHPSGKQYPKGVTCDKRSPGWGTGGMDECSLVVLKTTVLWMSEGKQALTKWLWIPKIRTWSLGNRNGPWVTHIL